MRFAAAVMVMMLAAPALAGEREPWTADIKPSPWTGRSEDYTIRDSIGRRTGTITRELDGDYAIRDSIGRKTGTITKDPVGDDWSIRDSIGRKRGSLLDNR